LLLRQWGESHLFSRGEKRLQVLDKRTGKALSSGQVHNAKGEILTANDLENWLLSKMERTVYGGATRAVACFSPAPRDCFAGIGISAECNITNVDGD